MSGNWILVVLALVMSSLFCVLIASELTAPALQLWFGAMSFITMFGAIVVGVFFIAEHIDR